MVFKPKNKILASSPLGLLVCCLFFLFGVFGKENSIALKNLNKLETEHIIPDIIEIRPEQIIGVEWPDGIKAQLGNELKPVQVKDQPKFTFKGESDKLYLLLMVDLDVPSRSLRSSLYGNLLHFMIANIPGSDVSKGDVFAEYAGAGPPKNFGFHRFVFLLYEQDEHLDTNEMKITRTQSLLRFKFSVHKFANDHFLGDPIGVNFFLAKFDDYVPALYAQFKSN